jgi:uncharacterized membrane protein YdjX (TVP38/TMEM64 family)
MSFERQKRWLKVGAPLLASICGLLTLRALDPHIVSQQTLSEWIRPLGPYAPLAFIFFLAIRPVTLLPGQLFTAFGGLVFGTLMGAVYAIIGSFLASALVFFLSRHFGKRLMKRLAGGKFPAIQHAAKRHDFGFAALTCINPLLPTDVMIAAAAASGARFWPTIGGILLGTLPGTFLTAQFGSAIGQGKAIMTAVSAAGMVLSLVAGIFLGRRVMKDIQSYPDPKSEKKPSRYSDRWASLQRASSVGLDG